MVWVTACTAPRPMSTPSPSPSAVPMRLSKAASVRIMTNSSRLVMPSAPQDAENGAALDDTEGNRIVDEEHANDQSEEAEGGQIEPERGRHLFHGIGTGGWANDAGAGGQESPDFIQLRVALSAGRHDQIDAIEAADLAQQLLCRTDVDNKQAVQRTPAQLVRGDQQPNYFQHLPACADADGE